MKDGNFKNRKIFSILLVITVLFCTFFSIQCDAEFMVNNNRSLHNEVFTSDVSDFNIIANVEELTISTSHEVLLRQTFSKKGIHELFGIGTIICCIASMLFFVCLLFYYIYSDNIRNSHRYIVNYIHSIDGQKA